MWIYGRNLTYKDLILTKVKYAKSEKEWKDSNVFAFDSKKLRQKYKAPRSLERGALLMVFSSVWFLLGIA